MYTNYSINKTKKYCTKPVLKKKAAMKAGWWILKIVAKIVCLREVIDTIDLKLSVSQPLKNCLMKYNNTKSL